MYFTKPILKNVFDLEGSYIQGPNSYRVASFLTTFPIYSVLLFTFGTLAGQRAFFGGMLLKMWSRLLPKSALPKLERLLIPKQK